jgi:hypothetical protein
MIKGKHRQHAFGGIGPDNFGMCGVGGGGISWLGARRSKNVVYVNKHC